MLLNGRWHTLNLGPVKACSEPVQLPTYRPLPFADRISSQREDRSWEAVHMENEFLRVMVLPEIGGRIHVGLDKTNGCDFF